MRSYEDDEEEEDELHQVFDSACLCPILSRNSPTAESPAAMSRLKTTKPVMSSFACDVITAHWGLWRDPDL